MDAQPFGQRKTDQQDELTRLRLFLAQMENTAYGLPEGSQTRKDILARAHEARGLKPAKDERVNAKAERVIISED